MPIDFIEEEAPSAIDFVPEEPAPKELGPAWPAQEGETIAEPDPERQRKREELANQMRLRRAERSLSDAIESFLGGAARAVEPLTPAGLMNQPTRIAGAIAGKTIPDIYQAGQPLVNVPQPTGTGFLAGLGQLGAQTLSGLTTPEMVVTAPAFPVSGVARALTAGEMAATLPESISRGGEVLRSPEATVAEKIVAAGQPIITAAMVRGLGQTGKWLPEVERTIAKAEPILPQAAEAAREAQATVTSPQVSEFDAITARLEEQERQRAAAVMRGDVTDPLSMLSPLQRKVLGQYDLGVFKEMARFANEGLLTRENFLRRINEAIAIQKRNKTPIDISVQKGETQNAIEERNVAESVSGERAGDDALRTPTETGGGGGLRPTAPIAEAETVTPPRPAPESGRVLLDPIVAAAFRTPDGKIFDARTEGGVTHMEADMAARAAGEKVTEKDAGFITQSGKFLTREEAYAHAEKTKQIIAELDTFDKDKLHTGKMPSYEELTPEQKLAEQRALDEALGQETTEPIKPIPNESVKQGDTIQWNPKPERAKRFGEIPVSGIVQDVIRNQEGEIGFNVFAPTKDDPSRVVRVWSDRGDVVSRQPAQVVTPTTGSTESTGISVSAGRTPQRPKSIVEIADEIAARGIDPQASYGQFVKARDLKPEISAREWLPIYRKSLELAKLNREIAIAKKSTPPPESTPTVSRPTKLKPGFIRLWRGGTEGKEGLWFSDSKEVAQFHYENHAYDQNATLSYVDIPKDKSLEYQEAAFAHSDVTSGKTIAEGGDHVLPPEIASKAIVVGRKKAQNPKPTPQAEPTPTAIPPAEPSPRTPAQQGSISETTTPQQITQAPFLDIPPEKWTPDYWKRIGDEGRRTVRSNLQGALQKLGSKTKVTERSTPQAVFNAIAEVNKARTEPPPTTPLPPGPGAKTVGEPPYAAAQQLTDQLRATPPTGAKDAYTLREKLADTWAQGKTLFERALGASRATAETLKDTARGVRAITDLDRRVGELDWLLQKSAGQSRNMGKAIMEQQKSRATREAVALWIDAGGDVKVLQETLANLPAGTKPNIRRALETAVNLPSEAKQFAQQIEQFYGLRLQDARQSEIFAKSLDDYFTHIWQKESNMPDKLRQAYSTGRVSDYFQFARQRKLPMFLDGILQGKTPELDPAKVVPYYNYALDRAIASRQFVKELSEIDAPDGRPAVLPTGTAKRLEPNEEGAQGGIFINPKGKGELGKDYHVIDHPAMRKWKWLGADEQGNPVMYRSDLAANPLVHERLARMLDQRLATPSKVGKALLRASTEVKGFKLGLLSAFHQVHVGSHALFHWTSPFKTTEIDWESPAVRYAVEKGHLKLAGDAAQIANFSEGLLSPGLVHKVPIVGPWSKAYSEWLFTDYIPRLKLKTFENALPRNLAWFSKDIAAGKITKEQVAARVGDAVNNAYGELNHWFLGKYGRSPQFQRILRGIFLAPDFGEARLRFVEKAFTKYGWEERMAFATMFLTLYAGARVANWLSHGDPETDLKNAFRVKVKIPGKDQMEWVSMRSVVGDLAHALTGFGQFMYVRLNPLYSRTISDILFQRDVYGRKLSFGDIAFKRPAQQLVPINFTGLTREDQSLWESAVTSAGLQVQHDVPALDIGKLKRKWLLSNPDPKLKAMGERNEAELFPPSDYSPLRRALLSGDMKKAGEAYDALKKEKGKKHADILEAMKPFTGGKEDANGVYHERKLKPIGGQIGADAEKKFLASLTPAERRLYGQALEERKKIYARFLALMKTR